MAGYTDKYAATASTDAAATPRPAQWVTAQRPSAEIIAPTLQQNAAEHGRAVPAAGAVQAQVRVLTAGRQRQTQQRRGIAVR